MFNLPSLDRPLDENTIESLKKVTSGVPPVIGPTPNIIGCLEAFEAFKLITGIGEVCTSPNVLTFDLVDLTSFEVIQI
ncbi:MAG: hypothetical protein BZ137_00820 [Methanosphaera sp. rholeuAM130]|nr:MAG: hypothetical protein BZ137_00820 [Methanosphaera sp. rholeuAM130]